MDNSSAEVLAALIGVSGVVIGALFTQLLDFFRQSHDSRIRQKEKIIERRITAHERVINIADDMMAMILITGVRADKNADPNERIPRGPFVVRSIQDFEDWWTTVFNVALKQSHTWLSTDTIHELNLVQDYFANLHKVLQKIPSDEYPEFQNAIRNDFLDLSGRLRKSAIKFLSAGAIRLNLRDLDRHHKFKTDYTIRYLHETQLYKNYKELIASKD